ncbi:hypothetical protein N9F73_00180 [bacterium]|nr:hypothetical protein [bacterium]
MANFIPGLEPSSLTMLNIRWALTQENCPHCQRRSYLKGHGYLRDSCGKITGLRLFCSNRGSHNGCGKTISVHYEDQQSESSLTTRDFTTIVKCHLNSPRGEKVSKLKQAIKERCSLATAYRWLKRFDFGQTAMRVQLCRQSEPEKGDHIKCPITRTWRHLVRTIGDSDCPLAAFQRTTQIDFTRPAALRFPNCHRIISRFLERKCPATQNENFRSVGDQNPIKSGFGRKNATGFGGLFPVRSPVAEFW